MHNKNTTTNNNNNTAAFLWMSLLEQEKEGAKYKRLRQEDLGRRRKRTRRQKACMPERVHSGYQTPIDVKN